MSSPRPARHSETTYLGLIILMVAASVPSLLFCTLEILLVMHGHMSWNEARYHVPSQNGWDQLLGFDALAYGFIARWNGFITLLATVFMLCSLLRKPWRALIRFALLPYLVILAADLILRLRYHLLP